MKFEVRAQPAPWRSSIAVLIRAGQRIASFCGPVEDVSHTNGYTEEQPAEGAGLVFQAPQIGPNMEPSLSLDLQGAQLLMDDLWACGLRPTEGTGSAGALSAVQAHLNDMRRLVFKDDQR